MCFFHAGARQSQIQGAAARERARLQSAEHELGVSDRSVGAAAPVAGGSRLRAGTARADEQHAGGIDGRNRAAAGADAVDVNARQSHMIAAQIELGVISAAPCESSVTSQLVLPISMESRSDVPNASPQRRSAPTPAAGPDNSSAAGRSRTRSTVSEPPLFWTTSRGERKPRRESASAKRST